MSNEIVETEKVSDETANFPEKDNDKKAQDVEILSETKSIPDETENPYLLNFLDGLAEDDTIKFIVERMPDGAHAGRFRLPSDVRCMCEPVFWNGETDPTALYSAITKRDGGGVYLIRTRNHLGWVAGGTWKIALSDPFEPSKREQIAIDARETKKQEQERTSSSSPNFANAQQPQQFYQPQQQPPPADPFAGINQFMTFADTYERFKNQIAPQQPQPQPPPPPMMQPSAQTYTKESFLLNLADKMIDQNPNSLNDPEIIRDAVRSMYKIASTEEKPQGFGASIGRSIENLTASTAIQNLIAGFFVDNAAPIISAVITRFTAPKDAAGQQPPPAPVMNMPSVNMPPGFAQNPSPNPTAAPPPETPSDSSQVNTTNVLNFNLPKRIDLED